MRLDSATGRLFDVFADGTVKVGFVGIKLPTSGGTAAAMDYFETGTRSMVFDGTGFNSAQSITVTYQRLGKWICMDFPTKSATSSASPTARISTTAALPANLQPAHGIDFDILNTINAGANDGPGIFEMTPAGIVNMYRQPNGTTAYTASSTIGWAGFSVCYLGN